jgi:AFG3 family protein
MDEEARAIIDSAYQRTLDLIREKREEVEKVANLLLTKETITHDDIIETIGPRPFSGDPAYEEYLQRKKKVIHPEESDESKPQEEEVTGPLNPGLA